MLAKPFNFVLIYLISIINISIVIFPFLFVLMVFYNFADANVLSKIKIIFSLACFVVSFLMLCYFALDYLLGLTYRLSIKGCFPFEKEKDYDFLAEIFESVKSKFDERKVILLIKRSDEINAYAVGSFNRKAIVLTTGLIKHFLKSSPNSKFFLYSLRSVISHEMSHLINKDFLPTYFIIINQKITNFLTEVIRYIIHFVVVLVNYLPIETGKIMKVAHRIFNFILSILLFFNENIVYYIFKFIRNFSSRSIEYRCDMQASKAFGGRGMEMALSLLGSKNYFTLFSTHPSTKGRIKKIKNVKISNSIILPSIMDIISTYISIIFLIILMFYFASIVNFDEYIVRFLQNNEFFYKIYLKIKSYINE